ncbi:MAG: Fic family protein [Paludibacter sp.]|jgi:Fic family protein|nr:Fic family protein [Paludibacter sp.]
METNPLIEEYDNLLQEYSGLVVAAFDKEDYYRYNEDMFTAHSCAIEGNSFSVNDTRELREQGLKLKLQNKSLFEAYEILDHFNAFDFVLNNLQLPLTEDFIKKTHALLTEHTHLYATGHTAGEYTTTDMAAGDTVFGDHEKNIAALPKLLESTQAAIEKRELHPVLLSARFHYYFIYLHPFRDGNGRLGRLLSNFILAQAGHPLIIIPSEKKQEYIDCLKVTKKHNANYVIENFFLNTARERMKREIAAKNNGIENFEFSKE